MSDERTVAFNALAHRGGDNKALKGMEANFSTTLTKRVSPAVDVTQADVFSRGDPQLGGGTLPVPPVGNETLETAFHEAGESPTHKTPSKLLKLEAGEFGYEILGDKPLGVGGMGVVHHARQKALGREVALKMVLNQSLASVNAIRRFEAEAKALGRLDHPNIVKVHEFGLTPTGLPFFALEFCAGGSLLDLLKRDTPSPAHAARLMATMARAVGAAHHAGIVHRDLKPGNVLLRDKAGSIDALAPEAIKIADFGLAKPTDDDETSLHTKTGSVFGTLKYMAPEQAVDASQAREPADIYSLGVILYEMLAGRVPFLGKDVEIVRQLERNEPVAVRQLAPHCPRDLETICMKCLEKDPQKRYLAADALAGDLEAFVDDRPILARPASAPERALKWVRRNPGPAAAAAAIAALLVVAVLGVASFVMERARAEREAAAIRLDEAEKRAEDQRRGLEEQARLERQASADKAAAERLERVRGLVRQLETVAPEGVDGLVDTLDEYKDIADPVISERYGELKGAAAGPRARLALALLPRRPELAEEVAAGAITAPPAELGAYADRLRPHATDLLPGWRRQLMGGRQREALAAAALLAAVAPADPSWDNGAGQMAGVLASMSAIELAPWLPLLGPATAPLSPALLELVEKGFQEDAEPVSVARAESAAGVLAALPTRAGPLARAASAADARAFSLLSRRLLADSDSVAPALEPLARPSPLAGAISGAVVAWLSPEVASALRRPRLATDSRRRECRRRARAIAALAYLGKPDWLWKALADPAAPDLVAEIRFIAPDFKVPPGELARRYESEADPTARRNLLALLGVFDPRDVPAQDRKNLEERLLSEFTTEPDPGVHGAAEWLLRWRWSRGGDIDRLVSELAGKKARGLRSPAGYGWRVNGEGQTLVSIPAGLKFDMGADPTDPDRTRQGKLELEKRHKVLVGHGFEIGSREVTLAEYRRFRPNHVVPERTNPGNDDRVPVTGVSWLDAAAYCQWLSRREMTEKELEKEWCFNQAGSMVAVAPDPLRRGAYRLPTEEEWELAARAGNTMAYPCGNHDRHLGSHGVTWANGGDRLWPCGRLIPNAWGLFDTSGNALEWTLDKFALYDGRDASMEKPVGQSAGTYVDNLSLRALRGGSFAAGPAAARMSARGSADAGLKAVTNGFRVCRTTAPAPASEPGRHVGPRAVNQAAGAPVGTAEASPAPR